MSLSLFTVRRRAQWFGLIVGVMLASLLVPARQASSVPGPDILGGRVFARGGPVEVVLESNGAGYLNQAF
jgi:hypothetical protein